MTRPPRDPKDPKSIDEASDTYDTIDWLLKNVKNNNGRVGMLGISYPGWLTAVAMLDPHPALKAASPQASPVDMFLGDDFHHNGAFRLSYGFEYVAMMETDKEQRFVPVRRHDTYEWYLKLGALSNVNRKYFHEQAADVERLRRPPELRRVLEEAVARTAADEGDGADAQRRRLVRPGRLPRPAARSTNCWKSTTRRTRTSSSSGRGTTAAGERAGRQARQDRVRLRHRQALPPRDPGAVLRPLPQGQGRGKPAEAMMFQTGGQQVGDATTRGRRRTRSPRKLYFQPNGKLAFDPPTEASDAVDEYVSDPANPVPYRPRPVTPTYPGREWQEWMVEDQRFTQPPARRADLRDRTAERRRGRRRVDDGEALRRDFRHRLRLDRPAHRRLPGGVREGPGDGRLPVTHQRRAAAGPIPQELREAGAGGARTRSRSTRSTCTGATTASARGTRSWCR